MPFERGSKTNARAMTCRENFTFAWPSSKIARMSSPGFRWCVREPVRAALCTVSSQTNACCALLLVITRGPEKLKGCAQPPHQQERARPEVADQPTIRPMWLGLSQSNRLTGENI